MNELHTTYYLIVFYFLVPLLATIIYMFLLISYREVLNIDFYSIGIDILVLAL